MIHFGYHIARWFRPLLAILVMVAAFGSVSMACPFMVAAKIMAVAEGSGAASCCMEESDTASHASEKRGCCKEDGAAPCCCFTSFVLPVSSPAVGAVSYESLPVTLLDDTIHSLPSEPPFVPPRS